MKSISVGRISGEFIKMNNIIERALTNEEISEKIICKDISFELESLLKCIFHIQNVINFLLIEMTLCCCKESCESFLLSWVLKWYAYWYCIPFLPQVLLWIQSMQSSVLKYKLWKRNLKNFASTTVKCFKIVISNTWFIFTHSTCS